ncbi:hypothetical protein GQ600_24581 [Phytophthora cactorum]|nr:hypothetical protein GQ600_24581 [Phytophthora cactorum]
MKSRLLTTVYIVRVASKTLSSTKRSSTLVIQRPRFAGGLLPIPLDGTVQLIQCSTKEVAHGIIRLQYGPKGKTLVMRAANAFERKKWIATIVDSLATHRAPNVATPTQTRTWKTVAQAIPRASSPNRVSITQELHPTVPDQRLLGTRRTSRRQVPHRCCLQPHHPSSAHRRRDFDYSNRFHVPARKPHTTPFVSATAKHASVSSCVRLTRSAREVAGRDHPSHGSSPEPRPDLNGSRYFDRDSAGNCIIASIRTGEGAIRASSTRSESYQSSVDTISSSADRLDHDFIPVLQLRVSSTSSAVAPIDMVQQRSSVDQVRTSSISHVQRRCAREHAVTCSCRVLSTVYLVCTPRAKIASTKHTTQAIHNLVVERPRIAGGTLTIPLDSTLEQGHRAQHHSANPRFKQQEPCTACPSPQEREQWMTAIASALSTPLQSASMCRYQRPGPRLEMLRKCLQSCEWPNDSYNQRAAICYVEPTHNAASTMPQRSQTCSLRRIVRRNIPATMQLFITVGQIIASAG